MARRSVRRTRGGADRLVITHAVRSPVFAGVERYIAGVATELAQRGHEVTVIGGGQRPMRKAMGTAPVTTIPAGRTRDVVLALARHARGADIVHVHMTAAEGAALLTRPVLRAPVVATRHFAGARGSSLPGRLAAPFIRRMLTAELSISRFAARSAHEHVEIVMSGVSDRAPVDPLGRVVLLAQRLEPEKRTGEAIDAWRESNLAADGWELWVAGDGSQRGELEAQVATRRIPGVRFLGQREDLTELRSAAGMFLAPASADAFGLAVAEAMASGLPVVAAGGGGHLETVGAADPELLYTPGDVHACAGRLRRLASDPGERRRIGAALRRFQQESLSLGAHVDRLLAIYRRLAGGTTRVAS